MASKRLNSDNKLETLASHTTTYIDYCETKQILEVEFVGIRNRAYHYFKVPPLVWLNYKQAVMEGKSSGEFVNFNIKPNFEFREIA